MEQGYTKEESDKVDFLTSEYNKAYKSYLEQKTNYERGEYVLANPNVGVQYIEGSGINVFPIFGINTLWTVDEIKNWMIQVKINRDGDLLRAENLKKELTEYKNYLATKYNQQFALENPEQISQIQAQQAKTKIEEQKVLFAQKNTQYIIIGVVVVGVLLTAFVLYKKFSK